MTDQDLALTDARACLDDWIRRGEIPLPAGARAIDLRKERQTILGAMIPITKVDFSRHAPA